MSDTTIIKFDLPVGAAKEATIDLRAMYRGVNESTNKFVYWFSDQETPTGLKSGYTVRIK